VAGTKDTFQDFLRQLRDNLEAGRAGGHAILCFGDATFPARFPFRRLRAILRRLATQHADVLTFLDVDEFRTSKLCSRCGLELSKVYRPTEPKKKKPRPKSRRRRNKSRRAKYRQRHRQPVAPQPVAEETTDQPVDSVQRPVGNHDLGVLEDLDARAMDTTLSLPTLQETVGPPSAVNNKRLAKNLSLPFCAAKRRKQQPMVARDDRQAAPLRGPEATEMDVDQPVTRAHHAADETMPAKPLRFLWASKTCSNRSCPAQCVQRDTNACYNFVFLVTYQALKGWTRQQRPPAYTRQR
jgi:hypothetical protein